MARRWFYPFMGVLLAIATLSWGLDQAFAGTPKTENKITKQRDLNAAKKAAAKLAAKRGLKPGIAGPGRPGVQRPDPGGVPHYFGPYGNWAFSPLPSGSRRDRHCRGRRHGVYHRACRSPSTMRTFRRVVHPC